MRTKLGFVLTFLGVFLLVVAVLAQAYAPSRVKKTPIDVESHTELSGEAALNGPGGLQTFPVLIFSTTLSDSEKSDDKVVLFQNSSCVVRDEGDPKGCVSNDDPDERLLTASTDTFAADRVTGLAVNDDKYLPAAAVPHEGLLNKFPFDVQKKTYPYWDGTVGKAVPAEFVRTDDIDGLEVYVFRTTIEDAPIEIADGVPGLYSATQDIYVEPTTGAYLNVENHVTRTDDNGTLVLDLRASYTDQERKDSLKQARDAKNQLALLTTTVPIIGYVGGLLALLGGLALLLLGRRTDGGNGRRIAEPAQPTQDKVSAGQ